MINVLDIADVCSVCSLSDPVHTGPDPYGHHISLKSLKTSMTLKFVIILQNLIAAAASEPEASEQGSNPNLYMWVKISILPLARCIMVQVGFYHNAARSVALKCTCVVAVWSFFRCRASFQAEKLLASYS